MRRSPRNGEMKTITTTLGDVPKVLIPRTNRRMGKFCWALLSRCHGDRLNEAVLSIMEFNAITGFGCHEVTASIMSSRANLQSNPARKNKFGIIFSLLIKNMASERANSFAIELYRFNQIDVRVIRDLVWNRDLCRSLVVVIYSH